MKDQKKIRLQEVGGWNEQIKKVKAPIFRENSFFDPRDKCQVKYEMLRAREVDGAPVAQVCLDFGFTRESFRHILARFKESGIPGLFDKKRGRKNPLKVTDQVREFLIEKRKTNPDLTVEELLEICKKKTKVSISRRTFYRLIDQETKKKDNRQHTKSNAKR